MIRDHRAVVVSAASLLFTLAAVAGAAVAPVMYRPIPRCGDFVDDCPKPDCQNWRDCPERYEKPAASRTVREFSVRTAALTGAIADGKMDQAAEGLDGLFSGSGSKFVVAGNPPPPVDEGVILPRDRGEAKPAMRLASLGGVQPFGRSRTRVPSPEFIPLACGDSEGCRSETGKVIEDATKPIRDIIDKIGDYLRDRNDDKLKK